MVKIIPTFFLSPLSPLVAHRGRLVEVQCVNSGLARSSFEMDDHATVGGKLAWAGKTLDCWLTVYKGVLVIDEYGNQIGPTSLLTCQRFDSLSK